MSWSQRLKGKHFVMERFMVTFSVLCVLFIGVSVYCFICSGNKEAEALNTKALYSTEFQTSKTNISGKVVGLYTSDDKTKAFLVFKFNDIKSISVNADNYQGFLTVARVAQNPPTLKSTPMGSIYVFGTTGYAGVYLVNSEGFKPQVFDLTIRCNAELVTRENKSTVKEAKTDKSFEKYDQFKIYFNPGATDAKTLSVLNQEGGISKFDLFVQAVGASEEALIKEDLTKQLAEMQTSLSMVKEYSERLDKVDNVQVPSAPEFVAGDSIEGSLETGLVPKFAKVVPGGYDFDWQHKTIGEGWLKELISKTSSPRMTYDQFFAMKARERNEYKQSLKGEGNIEWILKDGTKLSDLNTGSSSGKYTAINNDCQALVQAWSDYVGQKRRYQVDGLEKLLNLEAQAHYVDESATVNTGENVIKCY